MKFPPQEISLASVIFVQQNPLESPQELASRPKQPPLLTVASGAYDDVLILRAAGDACFLLDQGGYRAKVYKRLPSERGTKESALVGPCNFLWKSRSTRMQ